MKGFGKLLSFLLIFAYAISQAVWAQCNENEFQVSGKGSVCDLEASVQVQAQGSCATQWEAVLFSQRGGAWQELKSSGFDNTGRAVFLKLPAQKIRYKVQLRNKSTKALSTIAKEVETPVEYDLNNFTVTPKAGVCADDATAEVMVSAACESEWEVALYEVKDGADQLGSVQPIVSGKTTFTGLNALLGQYKVSLRKKSDPSVETTKKTFTTQSSFDLNAIALSATPGTCASNAKIAVQSTYTGGCATGFQKWEAVLYQKKLEGTNQKYQFVKAKKLDATGQAEFENLVEGQFRVTLRAEGTTLESSSPQDVSTTSVYQPFSVTSINSTAPDCPGGNDGSITVNFDNKKGVGPFQIIVTDSSGKQIQSQKVAKTGATGNTAVTITGNDTHPITMNTKYNIEVVDFIGDIDLGCRYSEPHTVTVGSSSKLQPARLYLLAKPNADCNTNGTTQTFTALYAAYYDRGSNKKNLRGAGKLIVTVNRNGRQVVREEYNVPADALNKDTTPRGLVGSMNSGNDAYLFTSNTPVQPEDVINMVFEDNCTITHDVTATHTVGSLDEAYKNSGPGEGLSKTTTITGNCPVLSSYRRSISSPYSSIGNNQILSRFSQGNLMIQLLKEKTTGVWEKVGVPVKGEFADYYPAQVYYSNEITENGKYKVAIYPESNTDGANKAPCMYYEGKEFTITDIGTSTSSLDEIGVSYEKGTVLEGRSGYIKIRGSGLRYGDSYYPQDKPLKVKVTRKDGLLQSTFKTNGPGSLANTTEQEYRITFPYEKDLYGAWSYELADFPPGEYVLSFTDVCNTVPVVKEVTVEDNPTTYNITVVPDGQCRETSSVRFTVAGENILGLSSLGAHLYVDNDPTSTTKPLWDRLGRYYSLNESNSSTNKREGAFANLPAGDYIIRFQTYYGIGKGTYTVVDDVYNFYTTGRASVRTEKRVRDTYYYVPVKIQPFDKVNIEPEAYLCDPNDANSGIISVSIISGRAKYPVTYELIKKVRGAAGVTETSATDKNGQPVASFTMDTFPANGDTTHNFTNLPSLDYATGEEYVVRLKTGCYSEDFSVANFVKNIAPEIRYSEDNLCANKELVLDINLPTNIYNIEWTSSVNNIPADQKNNKRIIVKPTQTATYKVKFWAKPGMSCSTETFFSAERTITVKEDTNAPIITGLTDRKINVSVGQCTAVYNWNAPTVIDPEDCLDSVTWRVLDSSNNEIKAPAKSNLNGTDLWNDFPIGTSTVEYTATDGKGQQTKGTFKVIAQPLQTNLSVKAVYRNAGDDITEVPVGGTMDYQLVLRNEGANNIVVETIKIQLPTKNSISFDPNRVNLGARFATAIVNYDSNTKIYTISNIDPIQFRASAAETIIKLPLVVSDDCELFEDACSNIFTTQADVTYRTATSSGCPPASTSTKSETKSVLVNTNKCNRQELICAGDDLVLSASGDGYTDYKWTWQNTPIDAAAGQRQYTVSNPGVYVIERIASCNGETVSNKEIIEVGTINNGTSGLSDPIKAQADGGANCGDDGVWVSHFFLCSGGSKTLKVNFKSADGIIWQRYKNEAECAYVQTNCQKRTDSCWQTDGRGVSYQISEEGDYRLRIEANGCYKDFYFTVNTNGLSGNVEVINQSDYNTGAIVVRMSTHNIPYKYELLDGGTVVDQRELSVSATTPHEHRFNIASVPDSGKKYTVRVTSSALPGCTFTKTVTINKTNELTARATFVGWSGCNQAIFEFEAQGGKMPYKVAVYSVKGVYQYSQDASQIPDNEFVPSPLADASTFRLMFPVKNPDVPFVFAVRDEMGKTALTNKVTPVADPQYQIEVATTPVECLSNGATITAKFVNGVPVDKVTLYSIQPDGSRVKVGENKSGTFPNQPVGQYVVEVKSSLKSGCVYEKDLEIVAPYPPLTASVGVLEDIACSTATPKQYKVKINNVSGGGVSPIYEYNIDRGWRSADTDPLASEGYVSGRATVQVRVKGSTCPALQLVVEVNGTPINPIVNFDPATNIVYDCAGNAQVNFTLNAPAGKNYTYYYSIDGAPQVGMANNTLISNLTPKADNSPYIVNFFFTDNDSQLYNVLYQQDFGVGNNTSATEVKLNYQGMNPLNDDSYVIAQQPTMAPEYLSVTQSSGVGRYLVAVTTDSRGILFEKELKDVIAGKAIEVSFQAINLLTGTATKSDPELRVTITSGSTPYSRTITSLAKSAGWLEKKIIFDDASLLASSATTLTLKIETVQGTAVGIDNIKVAQPTESCPVGPISKTVQIQANKAFGVTIIENQPARCIGEEGSLLLEAQNLEGATQIQYSINGIDWKTANLVASTTNRFAISLPVGDYPANTLSIRRGNTVDCEITVPTQVQITQPEPIQVSLQDIKVTPLGCEAPYLSSIVTIKPQGGNRPYTAIKYRKKGASAWETSGATMVGNVGVIRNLTATDAGVYEFVIIDKNNCQADNPEGEFQIVAPRTLQANITYTQCYSGLNDAFINIEVTDGNGGYSYSIDGGTTFTAFDAVNPTHQIISYLGEGTYNVLVKDMYGCTTPTKNVVINKPLEMEMVSNGGFSCLPTAQEIVNLIVKGGEGAKTFKWKRSTETVFRSSTDTDGGKINFVVSAGSSTATATATITISAEGVYDFLVEDSQSTPCSLQQSIAIQNIAPEWATGIVLAADDIKCQGSSTGFIGVRDVASGVIRPINLATDVNASKGLAPFSVEVYEKIAGTVGTTNLGLTGLAKGTYVVRLKDAKNCTATDVEVVINEIPKPNLTVSHTDERCNSGITQYGTVRVSWSSGGVAPFRMLIYNDKGLPARDVTTGNFNQKNNLQNSHSPVTFEGLVAGNYTVVMVDSNNCRTEQNVTIQGSADEFVAIPQAVTNCGAGQASVKLYAYSKNASIPISANQVQFALYEGGNPNTIPHHKWYNATEDTYTSATTSHRAATYTMSGLNPGVTYNFVVKSNGCYHIFTENIPAMGQNTTTTVESAQGVASCGGLANGGVNFKFTGIPTGVATVTYQVYKYPENQIVATASGTLTVNNSQVSYSDVAGMGVLDPGQYYVLLTETGTNCVTATKPFVVKRSDNPLQVTLQSTKNETCSASAELLATISGGKSKYKYIFKSNSSSPTDIEWEAVSETEALLQKFNNGVRVATSSTWYVFVKDDLGCVSSSSVNVERDPEPEVATLTPENLCALNGQFSVRVVMNKLGKGQHYYTVTRAGNTSSKRPISFTTNALGKQEFVITGIYADDNEQTVQITDVNGCELINATSAKFKILPTLSFNLKQTKKLGCDIVNYPAEISIDNIQNTEASKSYMYAVYTVTTSTVTIVDPITGNTEEQEQEIETSYGTPTGITTGAVVKVTQPGIYRVHLYDVANPSCPVKRTIVVQPAEQPIVALEDVTNEVCPETVSIGTGTGEIKVSVLPLGLADYTFSIENATDADGTLLTVPTQYKSVTRGTTTPEVEVNATGTGVTFKKLKGSPAGIKYEITALSTKNACKSSIYVTVKAPQPISIATGVVKVTQFACNSSQGLENAKIEVNTAGISGGSGDFTYTLYKAGVQERTSTNGIFEITEKQGGTYTIEVTDKNGCTKMIPDSFVINEYVSVQQVMVTQVAGTAVTCISDESIKVEIVTDPIAPTSLVNYIYSVKAMDGSYAHTSSLTSNTSYTFTGLKQGNYQILVQNQATGCEAYATYDIEDPNTFAITAQNPKPVSCYAGSDGEILLTFIDRSLANGDQSADGFSYTITEVVSGAITAGTVPAGTNTYTVTGLSSGTYRVTATSTSTGCTVRNQVRFNILQAEQPMSGSAEMVYGATCTNDQGEIYVDIIGGIAPYTVTITGDNGQTQTASDVYGKHLFVGLAGGNLPGTNATYNFTVTDAWGCSNISIDPVIIERPLDLTASFSVENTKCEGASNGSITVVNPSGGSGAGTYFYELVNVLTGEIYPAQTNTVFEGLTKGEYILSITDRWGCTWDSSTILIQDPSPISINQTDKSDAICYDEAAGYITVQVSGGTPSTAGYVVQLVNANTQIIKQEITGVMPGTDITFSGLRADTDYELYAEDAEGCASALPFSFRIPNLPDLSVKVQFHNACMNNTYQSELEVEFLQTMDWSKVSYAINSTNISDAKPFDRFALNYAYVDNPLPGVGLQNMTIFYTESPYKVCQKTTSKFLVPEVNELKIEQETKEKLQLNEIKVQGKFGVAPYTYFFNGEYVGDVNTLIVKRDDPEKINPATNKTEKYVLAKVQDNLGCEREIEIFVEYIDVQIPNYFTPTGDGFNDTWGPLYTDHYPDLSVQIFDRNGRLIKELRNQEKWDGTYEGKKLPSGDYWYILKLNREDDEREFIGHFTLYR